MRNSWLEMVLAKTAVFSRQKSVPRLYPVDSVLRISGLLQPTDHDPAMTW